MKDKNKVTVNIFGHEYKITGKAPKEYILKLSNYIDEKMYELTRNNSQLSTTMLAIITSINVADELFSSQKINMDIQKDKDKLIEKLEEKDSDIKELENKCLQNTKEIESVEKMYSTLKEEFISKEKDNREILVSLDEKDNEYKELKDEYNKAIEELEKLKTEFNNINDEMIKLKEINKDLENNYFDCQMKNVQLKKDLDDLIKSVDSDINY